MKRCIGCGAVLQSDDKNKAGYVVESKINDENVLCQRCFRLKHYGEVTSVGLKGEDYLKVINNIEADALVIYIVDLFDFNGSFITGINRLLMNNDIILLGNKIDLFPKSVNPNKMRNFLEHQAKQYGLNCVKSEVISSKKSLRIDRVIDIINRYQRKRNVYVVGCTNVGKSSFINCLLKKYTGNGDVITTSIYPGTTINTIEIAMNDALLIDTPGLINDHQLIHYLNKSIKDITPDKPVKPIVYQISSNTTLFIGGFVRMDLISGDNVSLVIYKANKITIHKTSTSKAPDFFKNHVGKDFTPPYREEMEMLGDYQKQRYYLRSNQDLVISGLGFVSVNKKCTLDVYVSSKIKIFIREAII